MISTLYEPFRHWSEGGSVCILSDLHFDDWDCKLMDPDWITPKEQIEIINKHVKKNDTFICLGDVGKPDYMKEIRANKKILILGNHDSRGRYEKYFDEIYAGPVFIAEKILLSHEPVYGLPWCLNIHGHDHSNAEPYKEGCKHINLAANVCGYTPVNLGKLIKEGAISDIPSIHRVTIDNATMRKKIKAIADEADLVVNGYAFLKNSDKIKVINLNQTEKVTILDMEGIVLTTTMNDIEVDIVLDYFIRIENIFSYSES